MRQKLVVSWFKLTNHSKRKVNIFKRPPFAVSPILFIASCIIIYTCNGSVLIICVFAVNGNILQDTNESIGATCVPACICVHVYTRVPVGVNNLCL